MKDLEQLNGYAKAVVEFLVNGLRYSEKEAISVVKGYYSVIERIGYFEDPKDWALKIDDALCSHITPEMWHSVL